MTQENWEQLKELEPCRAITLPVKKMLPLISVFASDAGLVQGYVLALC